MEGFQQPTGFFEVFAGFGLCEGGHLVELGVHLGVFEAPEMETFAVDDTIRQLLGKALLGFLWMKGYNKRLNR